MIFVRFKARLFSKLRLCVAAGIIDPALVATTALQSAASVAGLMLTTDVIISELKDGDEPTENAVS